MHIYLQAEQIHCLVTRPLAMHPLQLIIDSAFANNQLSAILIRETNQISGLPSTDAWDVRVSYYTGSMLALRVPT